MRAIRAILPAAVVGAVILGAASPALAQEKMTLEEWQAALDECNRREAAAQARINELDQQIAGLKSQVDDTDSQISSVRQEVSGLNQQVSTTRSELDQVKDDLEGVRYPDTYAVVRGDCLWNIAKKDYIYNDPLRWPHIYEANKDKIKDPNLIYPRQVFKIIRP